MAYEVQKWDKARVYFESGQYTLSQISEKVGISKSKISEKAKKEQWEKGKNADYIEAKKTIAEKKGTQKGTTITILDEIADEATKHLIYFQTSAMQNQKKANELLEMASELSDLEAHSRITARNKDTVLGKEPQTLINNTNAVQNNITEIEIKIIEPKN
ncbi:hypothetical protein U5B43_08850 [Campylobacter sp. 9BO]|uniref:hypothetical protein n=1 Tax=Campylobacter sp. 9BO TaxID=3424759 RepID=UPI003D34E84B